MTQLEKCYDGAVVLDLDQIMRDIGFQVVYQGDPDEEHLKKIKKKARKKAKESLHNNNDSSEYSTTCFQARYNDILDEKLEAFREKKRIVLKPAAPINIVTRISDKAGQYFGFTAVHMDAGSTEAIYEINQINVYNVSHTNLDMSEKCFINDNGISHVAWYIIYDYCNKLIKSMYDNIPVLFKISTKSEFWSFVNYQFNKKKQGCLKDTIP